MSVQCQTGILDLGGACLCELGYSVVSQCNDTLLTAYPVGWSILQAILLAGWLFALVWAGLSFVKIITSSTVADSYNTLKLKRIHLAAITLISLLGVIINIDTLGQREFYTPNVYMNIIGLIICFFLILMIVIGWHWLFIYDYANQRSLKRSNTSWGSDIELRIDYTRKTNSRPDFSVYKTKITTGTFVISALLAILWATLTITNLLLHPSYDSPVNWLFAAIMLILYLIWIIIYLVFGKRMGKSITFKSVAKWKLSKTFSRVMFSTIGLIVSFFISALIYFLLLPISDICIFVALIVHQAGMVGFLLSELQTYWTRLHSFPFCKWKKGRSVSPSIDSVE